MQYYSKTTEKLETEDYKIFYRRFQLISIISYILPILAGGLIALKISSGNQKLVIVFLCSLLIAIIVFIYAYFSYQAKTQKKQKTVISGTLINKKAVSNPIYPSDDDIVYTEYFFYFQVTQNTYTNIQVKHYIYQEFDKNDIVSLHALPKKKGFFRYEKL